MRTTFQALACGFVWQCLAVSALSGQEAAGCGCLSAICHVEYPARTQVGEMSASLAVCRLESERGSDETALYVVETYGRMYPPRIDRILPGACCPVIGRRGNAIVILYTSGMNTTCVTKYSVHSGELKCESTRAIAWNDRGTYRKSADFDEYADLLAKRDEDRRIQISDH